MFFFQVKPNHSRQRIVHVELRGFCLLKGTLSSLLSRGACHGGIVGSKSQSHEEQLETTLVVIWREEQKFPWPCCSLCCVKMYGARGGGAEAFVVHSSVYSLRQQVRRTVPFQVDTAAVEGWRLQRSLYVTLITQTRSEDKLWANFPHTLSSIYSLWPLHFVPRIFSLRILGGVSLIKWA